MPEVSVIVPTYNRSHLLLRAIRSILKQTFQDFEIIVVDDCSTDGTEEILNTICDKRITYVKHEKNRGPAAARNTGLQISKGNYIAFLDSDDEWLKPKLEKQLRLFKKGKSTLGLVHTGTAIVDESGKNIKEIWIPKHRGYILDRILVSMCIFSGGSTVMIKHEVLDKAGRFDETFPSCEDWDLWVRIARHYEFDFLPEILVKCFNHGERIRSDFGKVILGHKLFLEKYQKEIESRPRAIKAKHYSYMGNHFCYHGDSTLAKEYIFKSFLACPLNIKYLLSLIFFTLFGPRIYSKFSHLSRPLRCKFSGNSRQIKTKTIAKLKILQLITELDVGGAEKVLLSLVKKLNRDKYMVMVAYLKGEGRLAEDFRNAGIEVFDLRMRNRMASGAVIRLYRLLKRENIKILHTHLIQADICGFLAGKMAGVPVIISTKHNPDEFRKRRSIPVWLDGIFANRSDKIIAVSNAVRDFLIKWERISEDKFTVIHNGVDLDDFNLKESASATSITAKKKELGIDSSSQVVGSIGRLDEQKGHRFFLEAIPEILKRVQRVKFLIVGDGPLRSKLEKLSEKLKISQNVIFTGIRHDVPEILAIMDVFVLPSIFEGFGIVLLEAMAMERAVVASKVGGIPEIVDDGLTGILIKPANPPEIANSVITLLKNPEKAKQIGETGRKRVKETFSADSMVKRVETLYGELCEAK